MRHAALARGLVLLLLLCAGSWSQAEVLAQALSPDDGWATGGMEACTKCHDETERHSALVILQTAHGMKGDKSSPLGTERACQSCHGPSAAHMEKPPDGQPRAPVGISFGPQTPPEEQNAPCLDCHRGGDRLHWQGSDHDAGRVACTDCHTMHAAHDPMLERDLRPDTWRRPQAEACFRCHPQQRALMHRTSAHPIKEGLMRCSDCHAPHGSAAPSLLRGHTLNETCYRCHAEKRGPFLWEHAPAREDCSLCHEPHGSVHTALLKHRPPWMCQQCHMAPQHPSGAYTASGLPGPTPDDRLLARSCLNCHSEVHGSNHPSGPRLTR